MCGINNHRHTVFGLVSESSVISVLIYFAKSPKRHCSSLLDYKASKMDEHHWYTSTEVQARSLKDIKGQQQPQSVYPDVVWQKVQKYPLCTTRYRAACSPQAVGLLIHSLYFTFKLFLFLYCDYLFISFYMLLYVANESTTHVFII